MFVYDWALHFLWGDQRRVQFLLCSSYLLPVCECVHVGAEKNLVNVHTCSVKRLTSIHSGFRILVQSVRAGKLLGSPVVVLFTS